MSRNIPEDSEEQKRHLRRGFSCAPINMPRFGARGGANRLLATKNVGNNIGGDGRSTLDHFDPRVRGVFKQIEPVLDEVSDQHK
jgi:hypothetical protein